MPKKILHIIQSLENGGCENMLLRTLPLLFDTFEHHIVTLKNPGRLAPKFEENNIPVSTVHQKSIFDVRGYQNLLSEVRKFSPDIVLTYLFHADMIGRLFLERKISVPITPFLRTTYNHPKYFIARVFEKLTKGLVSRYLANSKAVKNFYVSNIGVQPKKITVIPNGIDANFFDSIAPDPKLRETLGLVHDDFVIICVGNLHSNKGHRYLLEAFEQLSNTISLKLLLVGDGTERKNLEHQIKTYRSRENILFLGLRTDIPQLLKISDCFVLPTLFEGMSNALMEAMAAELPVVTTDIPENRELIEHEKTGILVPIKDSHSIAKAIENLLGDGQRRKNLGKNAKRNISKNFDTEIIVSRLNKFLDEL